MRRILARKYTLRLWLRGLAACVVLQMVTPAAAIDLVQGLADVRGLAYDDVSNRLYFLEDQTSALKSLQLTPECEAATSSFCVSTPVATGFDQPSDVAVNAAASLAYVVTSEEPALWRVDLKSGAKSQITTGVGTFSQIVLAPETNSAYVTDYHQGKLWQVDLSTGDKPLLVDGLRFPSGLAVNADRTLAYVAERSGAGGVISEINLGTGERIRTVASSRFGSFGFLGWTDSSESALYAQEDRVTVSSLLRVDLMGAAQTAVASFNANCSPQCEAGLSGLAVNPSGSGLYVGRIDKVIRLSLQAPPAQRVFLSIGNVPRTRIDQDGYAKAATSFNVVDSPFGGTLDIFGNLTLLKTKYKAVSYKILASRNGGAPVAILASWSTSHWNPKPPGQPGRYETVLIAPAPQSGRYAIPQDYQSSSTAPYWSPAYLMMRWPTSENGTYTLQIKIFDSTGKDVTNQIPVGQRSLTVRVDNTPPVADLKTIRNDGLTVSPCAIVQATPNSFDFELEAADANGHLLGYSLRAVWGRNQSATVFSEHYDSHVDYDGPHLWKGEAGFKPTGGWAAKCNCAHAFTLQVSKRTINGYSYILSSSSHQSITINNTGNSCQ